MISSFETHRLLIRPLRESDFEFIFELLNSGSWIRFIGDRNIQTLEDARSYITQKLEDPDYHCHVYADKTTRVSMGILTFIHRTDQDAPDIGYAILPKFEKTGYTTEATKKYLQLLEDSKRYKEIIAITRQDNINSINVLKRIGMFCKEEYNERGIPFFRFSNHRKDG